MVAIIGKSVGLKGYLKLHNKSDFPEQFCSGAAFTCSNGSKLIIKHFDHNKGLVLFCGYESVQAAKTLVNVTLFSSIDETRKKCKLHKDEFFYFDIIGLYVFEDDQEIGKVIDIMETGAGFLLLIKVANELGQAINEFYLPYVDRYILEVDIDNKKIVSTGAKDLIQSLS